MISHHRAKQAAQGHLRCDGSTYVPVQARREPRYGVWIIDYGDPAQPHAPLDGESLVVTDRCDVHPIGSAPGELDRTMASLGIPTRAAVAAAYEREGEALTLLADLDPEEAEDLARWAALRHPVG